MVVGFHKNFSTGSVKLSRERSDSSCLSFSSSPIEEDDEATDIKPELLLTKRRQKKVTFYDRVVVVPSHQYLSSEEKSISFMSGEELLAIRYSLRALVIQTENDRLASSSALGLEENDENLRGLEIYVYPGKHESASRKERAFQAVFQSQQKCYHDDRVASETGIDWSGTGMVIWWARIIEPCTNESSNGSMMRRKDFRERKLFFLDVRLAEAQSKLSDDQW
jgi:hypothetical protein